MFYNDDLIINRVSKKIKERTKENMEENLRKLIGVIDESC